MGIAALVIIGAQHFGCKGFPKAPWPADTGEFIGGTECPIDKRNQLCFIHVNSLADGGETVISDIQIFSQVSISSLKFYAA